jgi:aminodeoxyfutalosine synthase
MDKISEYALAKGAAGERLSEDEALALVSDLSPAHLHALGAAALRNRQARYGDRATYVFNQHVNPSNVCSLGCAFCNYGAAPDAPHAFTLSEDEILTSVAALRPTEVHIVGGVNDLWPYERNLELVQTLRRRFPALYIKAFTAVEIEAFARTSGLGVEAVLAALTAAGMNAMPGGGAEIFVGHLRRRYWPQKISPQVWLSIHRRAHAMGITTNATMLYGIGERWEDRVAHMLTLRKSEAPRGGFEAFIPLPFQPGRRRISAAGPAVFETLTVLALARLILDNIPHLKAYWPMAGLETAAAGLSWGADDMDGTIKEEKVAHMSGAHTPIGLARQQMEETITLGGFEAVERDGWFRPKGRGDADTQS